MMVLKRGNALRQNIAPLAIPGKAYQFGFHVKMSNVQSINMRIVVRMRFKNNDTSENGVCRRPVCNLWARPLTRTIRNSGGWQEVVTEEFEMFGNYTEWDGEVDFILFQMVATNMNPAGEYAVTDFRVFGDDYTDAPSQSLAPSGSPTNLFRQHIGYVVRYAGEVRTVTRYPFQIDKTGEILDMTGSVEYQLCEVDEVEGKKAEFPNRMNFFIDGKCQPIRNGNPTVSIYQ